MKEKLRIISFNLCDESPESNLNKLSTILDNFDPDIVFLQEIKKYKLELLKFELFSIDHIAESAILINPLRLKKIDTHCVKIKKWFGKKIFIGGLHLHHVPSFIHHIHNLEHESVNPETNWFELVNIAKANRLPKVKELLKKTHKYEFAIIGGDFNEPSHLDYPLMNLPVSKEFEKYGFTDSYLTYSKEKGKFNLLCNSYTWPSGEFYKQEPKQRIDFIYVRNMQVESSFTYNTNIYNQFLSDHRMLISDVFI